MNGRRLRRYSLSLSMMCAVPLSIGAQFGLPEAKAADEGSLRGVVTDEASGQAIEGALVILQCSCLTAERTVTTNARGIYRFDELPPGHYTIQVLAGKANVSKIVQLPRASALRAHFAVDPKAELVKKIIVESAPSGTTYVDMEQARHLPVGGSTSRDFTAVVDLAPGSTRDGAQPTRRSVGADSYASYREGDRVRTAVENTTTFSIDVDTAAYANVRRFVREGGYVPPAAVRVEEMVNYFDYDDAPPTGQDPVAVYTEITDSPFTPGHHLLRVAVKGRAIPDAKLPPRNLVFLLDVSGSMASSDKLDLLKSAMHRLTDTLRPHDRVAIVVYAGSAAVALDPTSGARKARIHAHIDALRAGGSTNGSGGIELAYQLAAQNFDADKINRIILGTDGDFNVGPQSDAEMVKLIERKRDTGVYLSVLGVGTGNLKDSKMEQIADHGNGNYAYLDGLEEAHRVLVTESEETTVTVAKDVKVQIEFDPRRVRSYRQIGYENRRLANRDFADDRKDAGELGANGASIAYYELEPGRRGLAPMGTVRVRYKPPSGGDSREVDVPLPRRAGPLARATTDFRFGLAVAAFALELRGSSHLGALTRDEILALAEGSLGADPHGRRREFVELARKSRP